MRVIAGSAKGRQLKSPTTTSTRPIVDRVKTALFDILADTVEDATVLDLFGGVGSVGIEALSRGAKHAVFIELDAQIVKILQENLQLTRLADKAQVIKGDAFAYLASASKSRQQFDLVYIAPPQYHELAARALGQIDAGQIIAPSGLAIVQIHPKERIDLTSMILHNLRQTDERRYGSTSLLFYTPIAEPDAEEVMA